MQSALDCDLQLGADTIGRGDQHGVPEARGFQVEQTAKAADFGIGAGTRGSANHRLDELDQAIARVDINARIGVSEPVFTFGHAR